MSKLNAKRRNALPAKDFAGPERSYPIPDASHARNALARAAQHAGPVLKAEIRAKVHRKFPGIRQHDEQMRMHGGAVKSRADRARRT